jgi:hypothetical protein
VKHEEFAERAERRLKAVADRLEGEGKRSGTEAQTAIARAQELRVAALVVREEANAVSKAEEVLRVGRFAANPPLKA